MSSNYGTGENRLGAARSPMETTAFQHGGAPQIATPFWMRRRVLHLVLAVFTLATILFSLFVTCQSALALRRSVRENLQWASVRDMYNTLAREVSDLDKAGDDAIHFRDPVAAVAKKRAAVSEFHATLSDLRGELQRTASPNDMVRFLGLCDSLGEKMEDLERCVDSILISVRDGAPDDQLNRLIAAEDFKHDDVQHVITDFRADWGAVLKAHLEAEYTEAETLRWNQSCMVGLVLLLVTFITLYSFQLERSVSRARSQLQQTEA